MYQFSKLNWLTASFQIGCLYLFLSELIWDKNAFLLYQYHETHWHPVKCQVCVSGRVSPWKWKGWPYLLEANSLWVKACAWIIFTRECLPIQYTQQAPSGLQLEMWLIYLTSHLNGWIDPSPKIYLWFPHEHFLITFCKVAGVFSGLIISHFILTCNCSPDPEEFNFLLTVVSQAALCSITSINIFWIKGIFQLKWLP